MATKNLELKFNKPSQSWTVDIYDADGNPEALGIPLVTGADLLEQFAYLGLGVQLIAQTDYDVDAVPTFENLGTTGHMFLLAP